MKKKILARRIKLLEAEVATLKAQVGALRASRFVVHDLPLVVHDLPLYPPYDISCDSGVSGTLNIKGSGLTSVSIRGINDENQ